MVIALVLSGGTGTRLGSDCPKQYLEVAGKPVMMYCLETLYRHPDIDGIQIVAAEEWQGYILEQMKKSGIQDKFRGFAEPGETRQLSIYNGLVQVKEYCDAEDMVLVHDAARPYLSETLITACINGMNGYEGVLPVLPMKDTVYVSRDGKAVTSLLDRSTIYAGQAPEAFLLGKYLAANEALLPDRIKAINGSTEVAILAGMKVAMIPGEESNEKITTRGDLERFQERIQNRG